MQYFERFTSNTTAGSANQSYFINKKEKEVSLGRVFYKIFAGGEYNYSILFSNTIDSTFADGSHSHKNKVLDEWFIHHVRLAVCSECSMEDMPTVENFVYATFDGKKEKAVAPGELFYTDEVRLNISEGEYLCVEIAFSGREIPCHPELQIPSFVYDGEKWVRSVNLPVANMIGCDRKVKRRVAFLGDSITQGIGPLPNSYQHYASLTCEKLPKENSYWNLGIGYARADDAATDGIWLFKVKQADYVAVCLGVNDLLHDERTRVRVRENISEIVRVLKKENKKVFLQTIPPFNYSLGVRETWHEANEYIKNEMAALADSVFDNVPILGSASEGEHIAVYGGHPNDVGCRKWADALAPALSDFLSDKSV